MNSGLVSFMCSFDFHTGYLSSISVDTMMISPFHIPNPTYFQSAPCHIPTTRNVISEAMLTGSTLDIFMPKCFLRLLPNFWNSFDIAMG